MIPPLSPLQLKGHQFTNVRVRSIDGGKADGATSFKPTIWFEHVPNSPNQWRIVLTIQCLNEDPAKPYLYEAEIIVQGIVEVNEGFPEDKKEQLAIVNGLSILFSAAREMLINITARSVYGGITLPTFSFVNSVSEALKQKAQLEKPTPAAPV
jgi:preprotein translocase subunit SecB